MSNIGYFQEIWNSIRSGSARLNLLRSMDDEIGDDASLAQLANSLLTTQGEATSLLCAERFFQRYKVATDEEKLDFFNQLLVDFDLDADHLRNVVNTYCEHRLPEDYGTVFAACASKRQHLFSKLQEVPNGITDLVSMRADVLNACSTNPDLLPIDVDLKLQFISWFNRGFLNLYAIDWTTPANILEKIIAYEAVHEIPSWSELRKRLEPTDRRCYAFFHLAMPDEPLIFVEVALTTELPDNIQNLLDGERTPIKSHEASVAVFYSISNCQRGLAGISFGNFLIKQVARELSAELPSLKEFVTLSPIPGFKHWLKAKAKNESVVDALLQKIDSTDWPDQINNTHDIELQLKNLGAEYLVKTLDSKDRPVNSVARFHLGNGARIERLNYLGDTSPNGLQQSSGMMVNYYYDLTKVAQYHEDYALHKKINYSKTIKQLLDKV